MYIMKHSLARHPIPLAHLQGMRGNPRRLGPAALFQPFRKFANTRAHGKRRKQPPDLRMFGGKEEGRLQSRRPRGDKRNILRNQSGFPKGIPAEKLQRHNSPRHAGNPLLRSNRGGGKRRRAAILFGNFYRLPENGRAGGYFRRRKRGFAVKTGWKNARRGLENPAGGAFGGILLKNCSKA